MFESFFNLFIYHFIKRWKQISNNNIIHYVCVCVYFYLPEIRGPPKMSIFFKISVNGGLYVLPTTFSLRFKRIPPLPAPPPAQSGGSVNLIPHLSWAPPASRGGADKWNPFIGDLLAELRPAGGGGRGGLLWKHLPELLLLYSGSCCGGGALIVWGGVWGGGGGNGLLAVKGISYKWWCHYFGWSIFISWDCATILFF